MNSEQDPSVFLTNFFKAIIFFSLIVVGLLVLLAFWLAIPDALSWLSYKLHELRMRRGIGDALAQNMENGMVENRVVENGMIESSRMGRKVANMRQGPGRGEERVWWATDF